MNKQIAMAVALACLSGAGSVAFAQAKPQQQGSTGWYAGANVGRSNTGFSQQDYAMGAAGVGETKDNRDTAYGLLLGYSFDQNWALEGAYTNLGEPKYKYNGGALGSAQAALKNDAWSLSVKGTVPVSAQFDVFGRLGWTYNRSELSYSTSFALDTASSVTKSRSDAVVGVGLEFKPQKNWGIRAQYDNYGRFGNNSDTGRTDMDMWSLGAVVRF